MLETLRIDNLIFGRLGLPTSRNRIGEQIVLPQLIFRILVLRQIPGKIQSNVHMLDDEIGENCNGLAFGWRMLIVDAIHAVTVDDELKRFVEPAVAGILFRTTAMNQLQTARIEILACIARSHIV